MAENIELHSYSTNTLEKSDIEEYQEIKQDVRETTLTYQYSTNTVKEYDFFTQDDVQIVQKSSVKKKKSKRKTRIPNLMDIITSELASVTVPIIENVITMVHFTTEQHNSYLERTPRMQSIFQRPSRTPLSDFEHGWRHKNSVNLSPVFPRVLENTITGKHDIPVQYFKPTMFNDFIENLETNTNQNAKFLDIGIKNIKFMNHHQFSLEKLLCVKLVDNYNEYCDIKISLKDLLTEMKVNRETRDNLKKEFLKISPNKKDDIRFDQTVKKYTEQLLVSKEKYFKTVQKQNQLVHIMISLWSDIEMVREKKDLTETPYTAVITRNILNDNEFDKEWNEVFSTEFTDMLDRIELDYINKYTEYKQVKYTKNSDDSAKKKISKPKLQIDEEAVKEEVEGIVNNLVTRDTIDIILKHDDSVLSETNHFLNSALRYKYFFEIYVDDLFVCESDHFCCNNDDISYIEFTESFSVQILPKNTKLSIVLSENDREVSSLMINITDVRKNNENAELVPESFVFNYVMEPNFKQIGSGHNIKEIAAVNKVRLKSSNLFKGNLYTACKINIKMGWNDKLSQNQGETVKSSMEIGRQLKRLLHGIDEPKIDVLSEIIVKIYGKDISNDESMRNTLRNICKMDVKDDNTFPIDENSTEFIRLKLLHLRNIGGLTNVENKLIPLHASQISTDQLNCLQKSNDREFELQYLSDKYAEMDPIELQRFIGSKYLQKLNKNMLKNLNEHLLRKTHKDVVRDFKDLSLRNFFTNQTNLATLATISSSTKQQLLNDALTKDLEIRVTVLRAFNLLDRSAVLSEDEDNEDQIAGFRVRPLRPFVRLFYRGVVAQTATGIGCHPTWNQTVKMIIRPEPLSSLRINIFDEHKTNITEDYSDGDQSGKTMHFRCYSKWLGTLQVPLRTVLTLGEFRGTFKLTTPPILLGYENSSPSKASIESLIPEVTKLMKKDASFIILNVTTSLSHLGGLHGYNQPTPNSEDDYLIKHLNTFVTEYSNNFPYRNTSLTFIDSSGNNKCVTQFLQPIPLPDYELFPKNPKGIRSESALSKSSGLSKSSSSKSSGKRRDDSEKVSFQSGEERESVYSIYEGSNWRNGENQLTKLINASLRYVSLVPTYEVTESHAVTLMGLELLKILHGSPLDHTILLASYFLYLGIRTWVVVGLGLPRGQTSFVLTKFDLTTHRVVLLNDQLKSRGFLSKTDGYVWCVYDATSGERSELRDVGCPLKTVDFVFDNENIWVNMQSTQDCESVSFDFSKASDWQPVFDKTIFVMKQPVLAELGVYSAPAPAAADRLRALLEHKLRDKIQRWRSHTKTIWNRYCSNILREMLPHWEYWAFNPTDCKPAFSQRLKQMMVTYKMFGFPLNVPYASTKSVISTVKSTGVHVNDDPNAEFGLAVEVYAYPSNVLSVWVFLASVTRL